MQFQVQKTKLLLSVVASIGLGATFTESPGQASNAIETLPEFIYSKALSRQIPGMTDKQWQQISSIYGCYKQSKEDCRKEINKLNNDAMAGYFAKPLPPANLVVMAQASINKAETKIDQIALSSGVLLRSVLTPEQVKAIFNQNPQILFQKIELSDEQKQKMGVILDDSKSRSNGLKKQLSQYEYELQQLLESPVIEEKMILGKQDEINKLNNQIADEKIKLSLALRRQLSWFQLNKLYNPHRSNVFAALNMDATQEKKVMDLHCKRVDVGEEAEQKEIALGSDLFFAFQDPNFDEKSLAKIQEQIDESLNKGRQGQSEIVVEIRQLLRPEQREKLVELVNLENQNKLPPLPYPEDCCPAHHFFMSAIEGGESCAHELKMGTNEAVSAK